MHEAYVADGLPQIEELYRARIIDAATLEAWRQIDAGRDCDPALVDRGNRTLLFREQFDIIDRFYVRMLGYHWPEGPAFTYSLTLAGAPSVPGAHSFPERYPRTFVDAAAASRDQRAHAVGRREHRGVRRPLEADRRRHAAGLPRVRARPGGRGARAGGHPGLPTHAPLPVARPRRPARCSRRSRAGTSTSVPSRPTRTRSPSRATKPRLTAETGGTMIDLTSPPTRESVGFAAKAPTAGCGWIPTAGRSTPPSHCRAGAPIAPWRRWP